jgi:hypothetical protein
MNRKLTPVPLLVPYLTTRISDATDSIRTLPFIFRLSKTAFPVALNISKR